MRDRGSPCWQRLLCAAGLLGGLSACGDSSGATSDATHGATTDDLPTGDAAALAIGGRVQKGPFVVGSTVLISTLNHDLAQTGDVFMAQVESDKGDFEVVLTDAPAASLEGTGFFFDEVTAAITDAPLSLRGLVTGDGEDSVDATLSVLTHATYHRTLALAASAAELPTAAAQARAELVAALEIGPPDLVIEGDLMALDILGPDTTENAYLFAVSVVLAETAHTDGALAVGELQQLLNTISLDLADDGDIDAALKATLADAETRLDTDAVTAALSARKLELGLGPAVPNIDAILDQDHDGLVNADDNCPHAPNPEQDDGDGDGVGDVCDDCEGSGDDDGDGIGNACDNCPDKANPEQWDDDLDGIGNHCDHCMLTPGLGEERVPNCCHPFDIPCATPGNPIDIPDSCVFSGASFSCVSMGVVGGAGYGDFCVGISMCNDGAPCVSASLIPTCQYPSCCTAFCIVDEPGCGTGTECLPLFSPDDVQDGFENVGVCVETDGGPCADPDDYALGCLP